MLLAAVVACLLAAALSLLAWWTRTPVLRSDIDASYVDVIVLLLALLAVDAATHPTARTGVRSNRHGEAVAVLINAVVLTFLAGSIAYTAYQHLAAPTTAACVPGIAVALLTLVINGTLVMGRRPPGRTSRPLRAVVVDMLRRGLRSVSVLVASIAVLLTQAPQTSPIIAFSIASFMIWASWWIVREHEQGS